MAVKYNDDLENKIVELYKQNISPYQMVKIIPKLQGKRPSVIYGILKRKGIESHRKCSLTDEQRLNRRKYNVNDSYFEKIDTEHKAYWLGFIYADGFINTTEDVIGISLSKEDINHLEKFKDDVEFTGPIHNYKGKGFIEIDYVRIVIRSKQMKQNLISLGVYENKTDILKFPTLNQVPKELIYHFIRGYIDGDGSITYGHIQKNGNKNYSIKITGTLDIIQSIQHVLNTNVKLEQRYPDRNTDNWSLTIGGNKQVERILDLLYGNANVFLDRKYNRYIELKQQTVVHGQVLQKAMND